MPKIKEYNRQVGTQEGIINAGVNPEVAGQVGRAITGFGQAVANVEERIKQKDITVQTTTASTKIADARAKYSNRIKEESDNGTIDYDKIKQDLDTDIQSFLNDVTTDEARNYVIRAGSELKSSVSQSAFAASSELQRVKFIESKQTQMAKYREILSYDPSQYESIKNEYSAFIDSIPLAAKQKEKMKYDDMKELSIAKFRGIISITPDDKLPNLDEALKSNIYKDQGFDDQIKKQLSSEIRAEFNGREANRSMTRKRDEEAKKLRDQATMNSLYSKFENNTLTDKDVKNSGLDFQDKERMREIMKKGSLRDLKINNPAKFRDLYRRVTIESPTLEDGSINPKYIDDSRVIQDSFVNGDITQQQMTFLMKEMQFSSTPEGKALKSSWNNLDLAAKKAFIKKDALGQEDPKGYEQYEQFLNAARTAYDDGKSKGIDPKSMLDPKSKDSIYPLIQQFELSPQEKMKRKFESVKKRKELESGSVTPKYKTIEEYKKAKNSGEVK